MVRGQQQRRSYLIPLTDYSRIFRLIFTALEGGRAKTNRACVFFAMAGAAILRKHYKLNAFPVSGAAAYTLNAKTGFVAMFGAFENDRLTASPEGFHCWIECDGFAIDFMAPIFRENLRSSGLVLPVPRRMFQRPLDAMASHEGQLVSDGSFCLIPDSERSQRMIENFNAVQMNGDLANVCLHWYRRPPKRIAEFFDVADETSAVTRLELHGPEIDGVW